ncbi:hypothetical protein ACPXA8_27660, partial [Klebsiella pneumoniae]|uniref:hypothetical protein n=1 Tax=Klebsiella pneumoniae TaxID=573 RepID=UPI003CEFEA26
GTRMSTTLAKDGDDAFVHTTRVTLLGMPVYSTRERIVIDGGGRSFTMTGTQGALGTAETYEAHGEIADDAKGATYQITFYGAELTQR